MVMNEAASAPVVSATSRETPTPCAYYAEHTAIPVHVGNGENVSSGSRVYSLSPC
jgi:hypothetical protein